MNLKLLAISDTHLGEDSSLLSYPHGLQLLWSELRNKFGGDQEFQVDELILLGDIPDRCLSSTSQIITCTNAFMDTIFSAANIKKVVYIPGNHDHTVWSKYCRQIYGQKWGITGPKGDLVYSSMTTSRNMNEDLLTLFFGYPSGGAWNRIKKKIDFVISNPIYFTKSNERAYVLCHGTHFRPEVADPEKRDLIWKLKGIIGKIIHKNLAGCCNIEEMRSLAGLEEAITPFVDSIWSSSMNNPTNLSDEFWHKITKYREKVSTFVTEGRPIPIASQRFTWDALNKQKQAEIKRLTETDASLQRCNRVFLHLMLDYLYSSGNLDDNEKLWLDDRLTFVYGDTHDGGWGEMQNGKIRVYNCGCWVNHGKNNHPPCHIFAVGDDDKEYFLDISFGSVNVEGTNLLEIAASEPEHDKGLFRKILRMHQR